MGAAEPSPHHELLSGRWLPLAQQVEAACTRGLAGGSGACHPDRQRARCQGEEGERLRGRSPPAAPRGTGSVLWALPGVTRCPQPLCLLHVPSHAAVLDLGQRGTLWAGRWLHVSRTPSSAAPAPPPLRGPPSSSGMSWRLRTQRLLGLKVPPRGTTRAGPLPEHPPQPRESRPAPLFPLRNFIHGCWRKTGA